MKTLLEIGTQVATGPGEIADWNIGEIKKILHTSLDNESITCNIEYEDGTSDIAILRDDEYMIYWMLKKDLEDEDDIKEDKDYEVESGSEKDEYSDEEYSDDEDFENYSEDDTCDNINERINYVVSANKIEYLTELRKINRSILVLCIINLVRMTQPYWATYQKFLQPHLHKTFSYVNSTYPLSWSWK